MGLFAVNPRVWVVLGVLFALAFVLRRWRQWRTRRRLRRRSASGQVVNRP